MRHPRERVAATNRLARREFLRRSAAAALVVSAGGVLAACGDDGSSGASRSSAGAGDDGAVRLSSPQDPVTFPIRPDNEPIADGLEPEDGPLRIYIYEAYLSPAVAKAFGKQHDVKVEISTFTTMTEAVQKLRTGAVDYDVFNVTPDVLAKVVAGELVQPLNLSYVPNLANAWPQLQSPWYDQQSRYTVPYTVYTTGIGYRRDRVEPDPFTLPNPYDILWDTSYKGKAYVLDDTREALAMGMLRLGDTDVNTVEQSKIDASLASLEELTDTMNIKVGIETYTKLPEGAATVSQCWSGDVVAAQGYLPEGTDVDVLGYWYPPEGGGVIGSDAMSVLRGAAHPVLAHMFLDYLLDPAVALENFEYVGYQPAMSTFTPEYLVSEGLIADNISSAVVREIDFERGYQLLQLPPEGEARWENAWSTFTSGA